MDALKSILSAAGLVRKMTTSEPYLTMAMIRPLAEEEMLPPTMLRVKGLAVWQTREAFVSLFAGSIPGFDADYFRLCCLPLSAENTFFRWAALPADLCPYCNQNRNHACWRVRGGCCQWNLICPG